MISIAAGSWPAEIRAGGVGSFLAECNDLAGGEDDRHFKDVGDGEAVFETVGSAGVLGDVATDGTYGLRAGIRCVEEAIAGDGCSDIGVDNAGLNGDLLIRKIDVEDPIHAGETDDDRALGWERASAETGAGTASDERNLVYRADTYDRLNLFCRAGQNDRVGRD